MAGLSCEGEVDEAAEIVVFERLDRPMSEVHVQAVARTMPSLNDHPNYGNNSQYRRTADYEGLSWTILGVSTDASKMPSRTGTFGCSPIRPALRFVVEEP